MVIYLCKSEEKNCLGRTVRGRCLVRGHPERKECNFIKIVGTDRIPIGMRLITLYLPEPYIESLDKLVENKYYPNRAEAIRIAVRDLLSIEAWRLKDE